MPDIGGMEYKEDMEDWEDVELRARMLNWHWWVWNGDEVNKEVQYES